MTQCLVVGFCICLHQLLDGVSLMVIMLGSCLSLEIFPLTCSFLPSTVGSILGLWVTRSLVSGPPHSVRRGRSGLPFADGMIVCMSTSKVRPGSSCSRQTPSAKWQGTRLAQKKLVALLYAIDKQAKKEIREESPFTIVTYNIHYFGGSSNQTISV